MAAGTGYLAFRADAVRLPSVLVKSIYEDSFDCYKYVIEWLKMYTSFKNQVRPSKFLIPFVLVRFL